MDTTHLARRIITFVIGLFVVALGVALSVKADLGVSPISCVPYIYSLHFPVSMGVTTIILNVLLMLLQMIVCGHNYKPAQLVQLPVVLLFGVFTDFTLHLVSGLNVDGYTNQMILCMAGLLVIAFGVYLEVKAKLTYLPGEGMAMALADTFRFEFGKSKIGVDCSLVLVGVASSLLLFRGMRGIREGTIIAAIAVGFLVRIYHKWFAGLNRWVPAPVLGEVD